MSDRNKKKAIVKTLSLRLKENSKKLKTALTFGETEQAIELISKQDRIISTLTNLTYNDEQRDVIAAAVYEATLANESAYQYFMEKKKHIAQALYATKKSRVNVGNYNLRSVK